MVEPSVAAILRQRGWQVSSLVPRDRLLLPCGAAPAGVDRNYEDLRHYHFRRLLQGAAEARVIGPEAWRKLEARWGARRLDVHAPAAWGRNIVDNLRPLLARYAEPPRAPPIRRGAAHNQIPI